MITSSEASNSPKYYVEKEKILTFDEWQHSDKIKNKSDVNYGHYAEYVVTVVIKNFNVKAEQTSLEEDCPGGGDIKIYNKNGDIFFVDVKLANKERRNQAMGYYRTGENTFDFVISQNDVERSRSGHSETQTAIIQNMVDMNEELSTKFN